MKRAVMTTALAIGMALAALLAMTIGASRSSAGPAKYDPKTRSFQLNYTYAALPYFNMPSDQIESLGQLQTASPEQETKVRALYQAVSQILEEVTGKRAKIGSFEYVESIKKADVIISLTGVFERAGWSTLGTIEGQPGQIGLYYLYLEQRTPQEIANTIAHELCHYLFALPDEYSTAPVAECPLQNPDSPGCLMDNYLVRHGYRRLCTDSDHNVDGPRQNPGTIISGHTADQSCQLLIENFFKAHPPDPAVDTDGDGVPDPPNAQQTISAAEPFTGAFRQVVNSATLAVKDKVDQDRMKKPGTKARFPEASALAKLADDFFKKQIKELASDPSFVPPAPDQIKAATQAVAQRILSQPQKPPARFTNDLVNSLKTRARELATATPRKGSDLLKSLFTDESPTAKDLKPTIDKVTQGLFKFLSGPVPKALLGLSPTAMAPEERRYVEQIAREAVTGPGGTSEFATFLEAAKVHIRLSLNSTRTLNAIANEIGVPGAQFRKLDLSDLENRLNKFRLPGKPFTGFGFRRTYIVAPHPINPALDFIHIDAGDNLPYHEIRNLAVGEFMRLVQRERVEFLNDPLTNDPISIQRLDALAMRGAEGEAARELTSGERTAKQKELIRNLIEAVTRDRVENVVILAPPGGLPDSLGEVLEEFRAVVLADADVRVDVVIIGGGTIPLRLRDLAAQSGGSVQVAVDLDEVGAISQRLKNEIAAGSWVTPPQQGYIDFSAGAAGSPTARKVGRRTLQELPTLASLQEKYKGRERLNKPRPGKAADCDDGPVLTEKGELKPSLDITLDELNDFIRKLNLINANFVRTEARTAYSTVGSNLYRLSNDIETLGRQLDALVKSKPGAAAHDKLHGLLDSVYDAKQSLRPLFGSTKLFLSPLTSTDDYVDWSLRKLLVQEARELRNRADDALTDQPVNRGLFIRLRLKSSDFLERASQQNQTLTDLTDALGDVDNRILSSKYDSIDGVFVDEAKLPLADSKALLGMVAQKQREEAARNPDASPLLLDASDNELGVCEQLVKWLRPATLKVEENRTERKYFEFRIALLRSASYYLERASGQAVDPVKFGNQVSRIRGFLNDLTTRADQEVNLDASARLRLIDGVVRVLEQRSERLLGRGGVADPLVGATGKKSSFDDDDDPFDKTNALSPLSDSLVTDRQLGPAVGMLADELLEKFPDCPSQQIYELLSLKKDDTAEAVRERIEEFVQGDFPLLIVNILGRLRDFEEELQALEEAYHDADRPVPTFQRLARARVQAKPDLDAARDGHLVGFNFAPFVVEDASEMELIVGLSRPLRKFDKLRDDPPSLKLYRGQTTENLADSPFLAYDPEVSTETMLVFRVPKPKLKAGFLKAGQYTPRLMVDHKNMPILGRDNTVNYTFSVATIRPNVQLIAALRQPQPKDGDRQFGKDKEDAYRGTIAANAFDAIIEVQVLAGAPVTKADVTGSFQRIDALTQQIDQPKIVFVDDGLFPDLTKDDGIYTSRITLQPPTNRTASEYRVFIQASSNPNVKFIPLAEKIPSKTDPATKDPEPPPVPDFQRATSLNFHSSSDN